MTLALEPPFGDIWDGLKTGKVIPFLGAGASLSGRPDGEAWSDTSAFPPSGRELAQLLADGSRFPSEDEQDRADLAKVSSYTADISGRRRLRERLRGVLNRPYRLSSLHRFLAEIPAHLLIVVTNYDTLLEDAFKEAGEALRPRAEAQKSQTQIEELVKDANSKGLTVAPIAPPQAQKDSEVLEAPTGTVNVAPSAAPETAPPPPTNVGPAPKAPSRGNEAAAAPSEAPRGSGPPAVAKTAACQSVRIDEDTLVAASFGGRFVYVYLLGQSQQFKPPAIKSPDKARLAVLSKQRDGVAMTVALIDPKRLSLTGPFRIDEGKIRKLITEGSAVEAEVVNDGSFVEAVDGQRYRFTVETHFVRRFANVTICPA